MTTQPYTYLGLVNEVLESLNEVPLTSADFADAVGFHAHIKESVNNAISDIIEEEDSEWGFQWALSSAVTLATDGTQEYALESTADHVDWDSFYIAKDATITTAGGDGDHKELPIIEYDNWRMNYREIDYNLDSTGYSKPDFVVRKPDNTKFIISPPADRAYTVYYEYFTEVTELEAYDDVPTIPEKYRNQIKEQAKVYAYMFRDNLEQAAFQEKVAERKINRMRRNTIPQQETMRY